MKYINFLIPFLMLGLLSCKEVASKKQQPNIILIYADDLGRGMLSAYGQEYLTTPNIDRIANEGIRFEQAYGCQFCAPARASLLTGMHDCHGNTFSFTRAGIYEKLDLEYSVKEIEDKIHAVSKPAEEEDVFLAHVAKNAGYNTAQFGKLEWGFATTSQRVISHGWDYHYGYYDHQRCHGFYPPFLFENGQKVHIQGNTRTDCGKTNATETPDAYKKRWDMTGKTIYSEDIIMNKLLNYMDINNPKETGKPFFIYFPTQLPHGPISVPAVHPELEQHDDLTEFEKEYGTMIKILDKDVGRIYAKCEEMGILENTIIIFTGDNGHEVYACEEGRAIHGRQKLDGSNFDNLYEKYYSEVNGDIFDGNDGMAGLKRSNWEGGVRVPLFWLWKGKIQPNNQSMMMVSNYDILNTIAELVGEEQVEGKDGVSYAPELFGKDVKARPYAIYSSHMGPAIVSQDGWKLRYMIKADVFQLYHLPNDYREENVVNNKYPEKVEELKTILLNECEGDFNNGYHLKFHNPEK
ncbi:sulfatase-like hydrolase/transferase [Bacteroidales bacterium]|nr:sulfatase-like hydrolase/transferase [Bacteroidales bacterium]